MSEFTVTHSGEDETRLALAEHRLKQPEWNWDPMVDGCTDATEEIMVERNKAAPGVKYARRLRSRMQSGDLGATVSSVNVHQVSTSARSSTRDPGGMHRVSAVYGANRCRSQMIVLDAGRRGWWSLIELAVIRAFNGLVHPTS